MLQNPTATSMEGTGGTCRCAGGRWRGLAEQRADTPSEARGADGRSGRAAAHRHTQRPGPPYSLHIVHGADPTKTHTAPYARMTQMPMITHLKRLCAGVRSFEVKSLFTPLPRAVCAAVSEVVAMRPH